MYILFHAVKYFMCPWPLHPFFLNHATRPKLSVSCYTRSRSSHWSQHCVLWFVNDVYALCAYFSDILVAKFKHNKIMIIYRYSLMTTSSPGSFFLAREEKSLVDAGHVIC